MNYRAECDIETKTIYVAIMKNGNIKQIYDMKQKKFVNTNSIGIEFPVVSQSTKAYESILCAEEECIPYYTGPTYPLEVIGDGCAVKLYINGEQIDHFPEEWENDDVPYMQMEIYENKEEWTYHYRKFKNRILNLTFRDGHVIEFDDDYFVRWLKSEHPLISAEFDNIN